MFQLMASTVPRRLLPLQSEPSYASDVLGMTPFAYWRLGTLGSVVDEVGTRHGTFAGTGHALAAGLPQNSDAAVDFGGTASASVPNDAGLSLAAFSLSVWFKVNVAPPDGARWALVCRDESGDVTGDFGIILEAEGTITIGFQVAGLPREIIAPPGFEVGVVHHLVVRANNTGFDAYLDGSYLGKNTVFTAAWTGNAHPIRFASVPWRAELADVVIDDVALFNRVVTEAEVLELGQRTSLLPVANPDAVNVPESATTEIDVVANDIYAGLKTGLTVEITQQPAGGDSVTVAADRNVDYVAGAVAVNTARTFQYRITDPVGTSNATTVNVTVLNAGPPPPASAVALCYTEAGASVVVNTMADLVARVNDAHATGNRQILVAAGTYAGGTRNFNPQGTAANPVVVRPQNGVIGSVVINDATWEMVGGSTRLVISKLHFNNGCIRLNGNGHRVTRCIFRQVGRPVLADVSDGWCVAVRNGDFMRVDHCDMSDWRDDLQTRKGFVTFHLPDFSSGNHGDVLVDYNYCHDYSDSPPAANPSNVFNTSSGTQAWNKDFRVAFDHNLVRNATNLRDAEFVTCKFSGVVFSFNTFDNVDGYLQQRQGGGWEIRSNWFENMGSTSPLKSFDDLVAGTNSGAGRALVIGNRLVGGLDMWIGAGDTNAGGQPNEAGNYHPSRQGRYIGNIVGGQIRVGEGYGGFSQLPAVDNNLWNNLVGAGAVLQNAFGANLVNVNSTGTTFVADGEAFDPAAKIPVPTGNPATDQVGLVAADPLCPGGPQS